MVADKQRWKNQFNHHSCRLSDNLPEIIPMTLNRKPDMLSITDTTEIARISESVDRIDDQPFMIGAIQIANFRCFDSVAVEGLGLINVIVGSNSSGKTSFIESIFLGSTGMPDVLGRFRRWRGITRNNVPNVVPFVQNVTFAQPEIYTTVESDLFNTRDKGIYITIQIFGDDNSQRSLEIFHDRQLIGSSALSSTEFMGSGSGASSQEILQPSIAFNSYPFTA